ncbi:MAG: phage tail protein [Desulfobacteraceae bacterium]|nr:phage tail protein [Desulfobacteraceae bacterium]
MVYYPPVAFHFRVEIVLNDLPENDTRFKEVSGLTRELGVEQVAEGGENRFEHRLPSRGKFGNLVLKRGLLTDSGVIDWVVDALENFIFKPANVLVTLLNEEHQPLATWTFTGAWPMKWSVSDLKSTENNVVVETLELAYSYFTKTK